MKAKILIIEDNKDVRENIQELLDLSGYTTATANDGKQGVAKALDMIPDLILCDVMMPELDGFGVLKILSGQPLTADIPFIFLTAKTEKEDFRKGMGLGADDYITKPYDDITLLDTIELRLKKSHRIKTSFDKTGSGLQRFIDEAKGQKEFLELSENKEIRKYNKKDFIYDSGQYPKWLYFVVSGTLKSYYINDFGKEFISNIYAKGDFIGHLPILRNEPYHDTVTALEDCELRLIPIEDFMILVHNNREFSAKFIKMLANQSEEMERQLIDLAYSSVRKRVANALLKFSQTRASASMTILRDDIASLSGTTKETAIRTLSDFKNEGIITIDGNVITLMRPEKLHNMPQ